VKVLATRLNGPVLIEPRIFVDERGYFLETFSRERYRELGVDAEFIQDNHSRSVRGAIRGLHFQSDPGQAKLVRCARGRVFDVIVDVRRSSPTFGDWESFELDDQLHRQLYVPIGFAHGLQSLEQDTDFVYKVSSLYDPDVEIGIGWDDPDLGIPWPIADAVVSDRDRANPRLRELRDMPEW